MKEKIANIFITLFIILLSVLFIYNYNETQYLFIEICVFTIRVILPSLIPFMIIINFIINSNCIDYLSLILKPLGKIFKISGYGISCIISSILGGFPYSAIIISIFLKQNKISLIEAKRIAFFMMFPSLSFVISLIKIDKYFLYVILSVYLSSFICLLISSIKESNNINHNISIKTNNNITSIYYDVMKQTINSIFSIAFCIIFFNLLTYLLFKNFNNERIVYYFGGLLEFSNSSINILLFENKTLFDYIFITIIISFSSLSIIFQCMYYLKEFNIKIKQLLFSRIVVLLLSIIIFIFIFYIKS